jgi:hypothetical protein
VSSQRVVTSIYSGIGKALGRRESARMVGKYLGRVAAFAELILEGSGEGGNVVQRSGVGEWWPGVADPWLTSSSLRTA